MQIDPQVRISSTHQSRQPGDMDEELSIADLMAFLKESWKTIAIFTVLGFFTALLLFWFVPERYAAKGQIKLAQVIVDKSSLNPIGTNIEEPQALIARLEFPTAYSKEAIALCGLAHEKDVQVALANKVKLSIPKGVEGVVDLEIRDASNELARTCLYAVYQLIQTSQAQMLAPYIDEAMKKLSIEKKRLADINQVIKGYDNLGLAVGASYLSTRDEIRHSLNQISNLENFIINNQSQSRSAHLVAPIFLGDKPVYPQMRPFLQTGLLLGCFSGLVFALARKLSRFNQLASRTLGH
jgi:hypothetical protein